MAMPFEIFVMGVSRNGESGETFPTRILTSEIYWGISLVKSQSRPAVDPLNFDVDFLKTQNVATFEK